MANKKNCVFIKFNSWDAVSERITKEWIDSRLSVFMQYTLKSLKAQTNQDFLTLISYDPSTKELIDQALGQYDRLPDNVKFVADMDEHICEGLEDYDYLYLARIDSDDMYRKSFIQQLHDYIPREDTDIYNAEEYLDGKRYSLKSGHTGAIKLKHEILPENNFVIVVHSSNIHTNFYDRRKFELITEPKEVESILV